MTSLLGNTISHTLFAAAAGYVIEDDPSASEDIYAPGAGSPDGFLEYAQHEMAVRFNSNATTFEAHIYVEGGAKAGASTAYVQGGKIAESCMIAGPGNVSTLTDVWQPKISTTTVNVLHGQCDATLHYNSKGEIVNITATPAAGSTASCFTGKIPAGAKPSLGGEPIQNTDVPTAISYGLHSTITYLPSYWSVCVSSPCPGTNTYVYQ